MLIGVGHFRRNAASEVEHVCRSPTRARRICGIRATGAHGCAVPMHPGEGTHRLSSAENSTSDSGARSPSLYVGFRDELCLLFCRGKQGNAAAQEHGDDCDFDRVDLPDFEQVRKSETTAEQRDAFSFPLATVQARFPGPSRSVRRWAVRSIRASGTRRPTCEFRHPTAGTLGLSGFGLRRPMRMVSNRANIARKSISGSMTIQSASPWAGNVIQADRDR